MDRLDRRVNWAYTTIKTMLTRLVEKKAVGVLQIKSVQPTIPVILLTGLDAREYLAVARSSGVDRCLTRRDVEKQLLLVMADLAPRLN